MFLLALHPMSQFDIPAGRRVGSARGSERLAEAFAPSLLGEMLFFEGGAPLRIPFTDRDGICALSEAVTIGSHRFVPGVQIEIEARLINDENDTLHIVAIDGLQVGLVLRAGATLDRGMVFKPVKVQLWPAGETPLGFATPQTDTVVPFARRGNAATLRDPMPCIEPAASESTLICLDETAKTDRDMRFDRGQGKAREIVFPPGSLGPAQTGQALVVAPDQHVPVEGPEVQAMFGVPRVLAPAEALTELAGVRRMKGRRAASPLHELLERHADAGADDAELAKGLYPQRQALERAPNADGTDAALSLSDIDGHRRLTGREARALVARIRFRRSALHAIEYRGRGLVHQDATGS